MRKAMCRGVLLALVLSFAVSAVALAVPTLQLYIDGSTYDTSDETWVGLGSPFELWVAGAKTPANIVLIKDVMLYVSIPQDASPMAGSIEIQGENGFDEDLGMGGRSVVGTPSTPSPIQPHGIFPTYYWTVALPDLLVATAGDTISDYVTGGGQVAGDIQRYTISFDGFSSIHFDVTATGVRSNGKTMSLVAPFSHDAEQNPSDPPYVNNITGAPVPEPATMLLLGGAIAGLAVRRSRAR